MTMSHKLNNFRQPSTERNDMLYKLTIVALALTAASCSPCWDQSTADDGTPCGNQCCTRSMINYSPGPDDAGDHDVRKDHSMSKKSHKNTTSQATSPATPPASATPAAGKPEVGPVDRLINTVTEVSDRLASARQKLASWDCPKAPAILEMMGEVGSRLLDLTCLLANLKASGYVPASPRREVAVGDHVEILEAHRKSYSDLIPADLMLDLKVAIKSESKRGGLVLETPKSARIRVALTHVRRVRQLPHREVVEPAEATDPVEPQDRGV